MSAAELGKDLAALDAKATAAPQQAYWRLGEHHEADCGVFHEKRDGQAYAVFRAPKYASKKEWGANSGLYVVLRNNLPAILDTLSVKAAVDDGDTAWSKFYQRRAAEIRKTWEQR